MNFWPLLPRPIIGLSPMDGVTDASFRAIIAREGKPDVSFTEFTHVHDICRGPEFLLETLIYSEMERPMVAQLYGKDPDLFYQATHAVCELGFDGVDINMGCPSKSVASSGSGAGLIKTPELARAIIQATRRGLEDWAGGQTLEQVGFKPCRIAALHRLNERRGAAVPVARRLLPLSVKTRLGYDTVAVEPWVEQLLLEQPALISLHGRTLQQMYRGAADWEAIRRAAALASGTGTLLLGNGDVHSLEEAGQRVRETGVDGVLIGRAVLGAPWLFDGKEHARALAWRQGDESGVRLPISLDRRFAVLLEHARQFQGLLGPRQFHRMRKHLGWYCKGFPHAAALRARMFRVSSVEELESVVAAYRLQGVVDGTSADSVDDLDSLTSRCS
ncbi:MAG: tRNA-dihydrouridine synthase [Nitrospiraceae bacterium]|nr:tRNA-dihydrouridine synthase [Nitrospiraceae bacterium]